MRRRRKSKKQVEEKKSMIGKIIDLSLEDFEKELIKQKVNIGTMNNLILNLSASYNELRIRKDGIFDMISQGRADKNDPAIVEVIKGLYAEMTKVEQKITFLRQRVQELISVD